MFDLSPRIMVWLQFRVLPKTAMVCEQGLPTVTSLPTKTRVTRSAGCNPDHKAIETRQPLRDRISAGHRAELVHSASSLVQQRRRMEQLPGHPEENDAFARQHIQIYQAYIGDLHQWVDALYLVGATHEGEVRSLLMESHSGSRSPPLPIRGSTIEKHKWTVF
jgi:hypothetical protein